MMVSTWHRFCTLKNNTILDIVVVATDVDDDADDDGVGGSISSSHSYDNDGDDDGHVDGGNETMIVIKHARSCSSYYTKP